MYQKVKGTRDFYPDELDSRNKIFTILRNTANHYGFAEVETSVMETMSLLTAKQGDEIKNQIFVLEKRSTEELGLRFDLTVPLTRMFSAVQMSANKPVKWYALSKMWRYEQPQKGRLREFYQISVELFGTDKVESDFEIVALSIDCLKNLGLKSDDFVIKVNNRKFLQGFIEGLDIKNYEAVFKVIDSYTKSTKEEFKEDLEKLELSSQQVSKIMNFMTAKLDSFEEDDMNELMRQGYNELKELFEMFDSLGFSDYVQFCSYIARGLSYYTGVVFECFDREGKFRAILGGGRYDNMVEQFGAQKTPALGFAIGDVTLELLLREKGLWPESKKGPEYYIAPTGKDVLIDAYKIAMQLRSKYIVDIDLSSRKLGKQFNYADSIGAKNVIVIGADEVKSGKFKVRDMKSGKEEIKSVEEMIE